MGENSDESVGLAAFGGWVAGILLTLILIIPFGFELRHLQVGDLGTWAQAVGVVVGVIYAGRQLKLQRIAYEQTTRPYVSVTFTVDTHSNTWL
jgi:hypothetical protein